MQMQMHWSDMEYCRMIQYDFNKMVHSTKKLTGSPEIKVDLCVLWKSNFRTTDDSSGTRLIWEIQMNLHIKLKATTVRVKCVQTIIGFQVFRLCIVSCGVHKLYYCRMSGSFCLDELFKLCLDYAINPCTDMPTKFIG